MHTPRQVSTRPLIASHLRGRRQNYGFGRIVDRTVEFRRFHHQRSRLRVTLVNKPQSVSSHSRYQTMTLVAQVLSQPWDNTSCHDLDTAVSTYLFCAIEATRSFCR